jgi:HAD superfamily hydrolase (TIGR01490 family)
MRAAFFDLDGTLTRHRVWQGLMDYFRVHRVRRLTYVFFLVYHYSLYGLYRLGIISQVGFRAPWARHLSWFLRGYSLEQTEAVWDWVVKERINHQWRPDILEVFRGHKEAGDLTFIVSGGPEGLLRRVADEIGADFAVGTRHAVREGVYTGRASGEACQGEYKTILTQGVIAEHGLDIDLSASYAYADSGGDIPLLEMVGNPAAVYPDEELRALAEKRGWRILPEDFGG